MGSGEEGKKCRSAGSALPLRQGSQWLSGKLATAGLRAKYSVHACSPDLQDFRLQGGSWVGITLDMHGASVEQQGREELWCRLLAKGCMAAVV